MKTVVKKTVILIFLHHSLSQFCLFLLFSTLITGIATVQTIQGAWPWPRWQVISCDITAIDKEGKAHYASFAPSEDVTVETCYKFGANPTYCGDWKKNIRDACKASLNRFGKSRGLQSVLSNAEIIEFDGCAQAPVPKGIMSVPDWISRNLLTKAFPSLEGYYQVCTHEELDIKEVPEPKV